MATSILEAVFAQAKAAVSRGYLAAGVLPALTLVIGWQTYKTNGFGHIQALLAGALKEPAKLSAASMQVVLAVLTLGLMLYIGRGLVLHILEDIPGPPLRLLRRVLLDRQIDLWWLRRRKNSVAERQSAVIALWRDRTLNKHVRPSPDPDTPAVAALEASQKGRGALQLCLLSSHNMDEASVRAIIDGLWAFGLLTGDSRTSEESAWNQLLDAPGNNEVVARLSSEAQRRMLRMYYEVNRQPREELWLAPTELGNRVAALEDYATRRYKISTSTLFTRLWGTLGQAERAEIVGAQLTFETFATLTVTIAILIVAVSLDATYHGILLFAAGSTLIVDWWTTGFLLASLALWYGSYTATIYAFGAVAENIKRLIDLYRVRVLIAFGFAAPATFAEEQEIFKELDDFFASGTDDQLKLRKLEGRLKTAKTG